MELNTVVDLHFLVSNLSHNVGMSANISIIIIEIAAM